MRFAPIDDVDWDFLIQPRSNQLGEVRSALRSLHRLTREQEIRRVSSRVLNSLGNNHCGTFFPVAFAIVECLLAILAAESPAAARCCALETLIDLQTFWPDSEHYGADPAKSERIRDDLGSSIRRQLDLFKRIAEDPGEAEATRKSARTLIADIVEWDL